MNLALNNQTMSSREIAELTGKEHKNVTRTIESLNDANILTAQIEPLSFDHRGSRYKYYALNKRDSLVVVARLSPEFTAKVIDRWQELESKQAPQLPQSKREWIEFALEQEKKLELAAPKVAFVDNLVDKTNLLTATQVAQKHKLSAIKLNKILEGLKVYHLGVKRTRVFRQWFVDKNYGEMKKNDAGFDNALFTNSGEIWINEQIIKLWDEKL